MFGRDDDQGRLVEAAVFEFGHHLPDRIVGKLDLAEQRLGWRAGIVQIAAPHSDGFFYELLANTDDLKVHAEDLGYRPGKPAAVIPAVDLIDDSLHLQAVVALDIGKAVGPGVAARYGRLIRQRVAAGHAAQRHRNRDDFGRVVIVHVRPAAGPETDE